RDWSSDVCSSDLQTIVKTFDDLVVKSLYVILCLYLIISNFCLRERARFAKRTARERARSASEQRVKTIRRLFAFWTLLFRDGPQRPEHLDTCCFDRRIPKELLHCRKLIASQKSVSKNFQGPKKITLMYSYGKFFFLVGHFSSETVLQDQST